MQKNSTLFLCIEYFPFVEAAVLPVDEILAQKVAWYVGRHPPHGQTVAISRFPFIVGSFVQALLAAKVGHTVLKPTANSAPENIEKRVSSGQPPALA